MHDLQSLRQTSYEDGFGEPDDPLTLEQLAVEGSAALLTVSAELLKEIAARYRLPAHALVFGNYVLRDRLPIQLPPPDRPQEGLWRIVYQGTLSVSGGHYDLREIFRMLSGGGVALDVYPAREAPDYRILEGIRCHNTLDPYALLQSLPQYDFGWAGFNATRNGAHLDTVLPNKVFEYLGCGLPILTLGHRALEQFVHTHGVGLSLEDVGDLGACLDALDMTALRRRVAEVRFDFTVERTIHRVVELYETLL